MTATERKTLPKALVRTLLLASLAILAFAGNSLITRFAFSDVSTNPEVSPVQFATVRLVSGAVMLAMLRWRNLAGIIPGRADAVGALSLVTYAMAFTCAYVELGASTGALILFAMVQISLAAINAYRSRLPTPLESFGIVLAFAGVVWLLVPGAVAPPLLPALLMAGAGIAWGFYTMHGKGASDPLALTARNFTGAALLALLISVVLQSPMLDSRSLELAVLSGVITSALGYVIWYAALPGMSVSSAGAAQLLVPLVAAFFAVLSLGEALSTRLLVSTALVVLGIGITLMPRKT